MVRMHKKKMTSVSSQMSILHVAYTTLISTDIASSIGTRFIAEVSMIDIPLPLAKIVLVA